ncbi:unnamed protein product [Moneuplotes crassus]|uniref:Uncharacterized protein n=1 Tax=Euplotes crassus TaxID=5936 RepID=A0AAD1U896_EUPCR|nr:unnamed protein product [Moneuplotes crassus]
MSLRRSARSRPSTGTTRGVRLGVKYAWDQPEKKPIEYESEKSTSKKLSDTWDKRRSRYIQGYTKINERNTTTWRETDPDPSETLESTNYHLKTRTHIPSPEKPSSIKSPNTFQKPSNLPSKKLRFYKPGLNAPSLHPPPNPTSPLSQAQSSPLRPSAPSQPPLSPSNPYSTPRYTPHAQPKPLSPQKSHTSHPPQPEVQPVPSAALEAKLQELLEENESLQQALEEEQERAKAGQDQILCLRGELDKVKIEKEKEARTLEGKEREKYKQEIANLKYQMRSLQDREEAYMSEKAHLKLAIENYEMTNKRLREQELRSQKEINALHERVSDREVNIGEHKRLKQQLDSLKQTFEFDLKTEKDKSEALLRENQILRDQLSKNLTLIQQLMLQMETLKATVQRQDQNMVVASNDEYFKHQLSASPNLSPPSNPGPQQIIPSPKGIQGSLSTPALNDLNDRAGIKPKKHCTINCIFSPYGCEQCEGKR